jgi:hypothetical protein
MKRWLTSLIIREIKIKTIIWYHCASNKMANINSNLNKNGKECREISQPIGV